MIFGQSNFLQALGWAVLNSLWQMALLWVIYQVLTGVFRKTNSTQKSTLAGSMILAGFAWFLYTFISIFNAHTPDNGAITSFVLQGSNNEQLNQWLESTLPLASIVYLSLLLLPLFNYLRNYRYVQAIRKHELSKIDVEWRIFVKNLAGRMGITKPVKVWLSGIVTSPVTIGFMKPVILLPLAAVNHLSTQQIEAILLHELAHIRRFDYLMNLLVRFIQAILYFNPFIKALVKIVEREREKSCDEIVLQFQYDPYGYASALLTLEKANVHPTPLSVAASGKKNDLLHRIECLLGVQKKQGFSFNKLAGLVAGLLCFIAFNALLILSRPESSGNSLASLTRLSSPFYVHSDDAKNMPVQPSAIEATEIPSRSFFTSASRDEDVNVEVDVEQPVSPEAMPPYAYQFANSSLPFMNVSFTEMPAIPKLKEYQEVQIQEALTASRRVLEEKQWEAVERKLADVATSFEKSVLKDQYEEQMKKVDWEKMEDKLRLAYDRIEWNKVNEELNKAITEIKIDSLQDAYSSALVELSALQQQLSANNMKGIPDTDISLKNVEQSRKEVQKAIITLNRVKAKKIIHL